MGEERRDCGSRSTRIETDGLGIDGEIVSFFRHHPNTQAISNLERKSYHIISIPFFFFFFFWSTRRNEFLYSISFLYFAPPSRPPLYFFFSGHVKIFVRHCVILKKTSRHRSLHCIFSSLLSAYSSLPLPLSYFCNNTFIYFLIKVNFYVL